VVLVSTVTIYLSDGEGFGIPPLESLALGVPVIVSAGVPSLHCISSHGQVRLDYNTAEALVDVLARFADRKYAQAMPQETAMISVPTWRNFAIGVFNWIDRTNDANRATFFVQRVAGASRALGIELEGCLIGANPTSDVDGTSTPATQPLFAQLGF